jgi:hypothetical protein
MYLRHGIVIHSVILSHGVLFFISVLGHYPRFAHPCYQYRNVLSHVGVQGPTSAGDVRTA